MSRRLPAQPTSPEGPRSDLAAFASTAPVDGAELMANWGLPQETWNTITIKTFRPVPGSRLETLVDSCPLSDWNLNDLAKNYGPSTYRMAPGPGPFSAKTCTVHVSDDFARRAGWGAPPPNIPSASEALAARTLQQATHAPTEPLQLLQAFEAMWDRRERELLAKIQPQQQAPSGGMDALALILKGFEISGMLQQKAMETVTKMTGLGGLPTAEVEPKGWADVVLQLGPSILETVNNVVKSAPVHAPAPQALPQNAAPRNTLPMAQPVNRNPEIKPQEPTTVGENVSDETRDAIVALSEDEKTAIAPAIGLFKPHADRVVPLLAGPMPISLIASQIAGYLGPDLLPSIKALAAVGTRNCKVLGVLNEKLATERAAELLRAVADSLEADYGDEG